MTQGVYSSYENRGSMPPAQVLEKFNRLFNININWLITGEGDMTNVKNWSNIPLLSHQVSSGSSVQNIDKADISQMLEVSPELFKSATPDKIRAIRVFGDSMEIDGQGYCHGDICFFSTEVQLRGDGVYIILLDDQLLIKRLQFTPGKITVISDNPKYKPIEYIKGPDSLIHLEVVGVVVGKLSVYE